ncbi:MAG: hypothetical protein WCV90_01385 [Candidatus Woesearchaeota archaeon]
MTRFGRFPVTGHEPARYATQAYLACSEEPFSIDGVIRTEEADGRYKLEGEMQIYWNGGLTSKVRTAQIPLEVELRGGTPTTRKRFGKVMKGYVNPDLRVTLDYASLAEGISEPGRVALEELADRISEWQTSHQESRGQVSKMYQACLPNSLLQRVMDLSVEDRTKVNSLLVVTAIAEKLTWSGFTLKEYDAEKKLCVSEDLKDKITEQGRYYALNHEIKVVDKIADVTYESMARARGKNKARGKIEMPYLHNATWRERRPGRVTIISGGN